MSAKLNVQAPKAPGGARAMHAVVGAHDELEGRRLGRVLEDNGCRVTLASDLVPTGGSRKADVLVATSDWVTAESSSTLREELPTVPLVVISRIGGRLAVDDALAAGAVGFVTEDQVDDRLAATVRAVSVGQLVIPADGREIGASPILSPRERQVMSMVVLGFSNRQVANKLHVTETTVKSHLSSSYRKLGVRSRHEATALILSNKERGLGILSLSPEH
jgi:DNA-binding NarL/FixJ family response regulator